MSSPANTAQPITDDERKRKNEEVACAVLVLTWIVGPLAVLGLLFHGLFIAALLVGGLAFLVGVVAAAERWSNSPEGIAQHAKEEADHEKRLTDLAEEAAAAQKAAAEYRARRQRATASLEPAAGDPIIDQMKKRHAETVARHAARKEIIDQIVAEYGCEKNVWPQHLKDMLQDLDELIASGGQGQHGSPWGHQ